MSNIEINSVSPEFMDIEAMKKSINRYLDKSDSMVRTLYEVLFLESSGHEVSIRVAESDFQKEARVKRRLLSREKRDEQRKLTQARVNSTRKED